MEEGGPGAGGHGGLGRAPRALSRLQAALEGRGRLWVQKLGLGMLAPCRARVRLIEARERGGRPSRTRVAHDAPKGLHGCPARCPTRWPRSSRANYLWEAKELNVPPEARARGAGFAHVRGDCGRSTPPQAAIRVPACRSRCPLSNAHNGEERRANDADRDPDVPPV